SAAQRLPLAGPLVPDARETAVRGDVHESDSADLQEVDFAIRAVDLQFAGVCLDRAAVVVLDLPRLDHVTELLRGRDVGTGEQSPQVLDTRLTLLEQERHVELDELLEAGDHARHQRKDLPLDDGYVV